MTTTQPTIAEHAAALDATLATRVPAEILNVFGAERARLGATGLPDTVPAPGMAMPDGDVLDAHGNPTTLSAVLAGRPAVVVFYRGAWCPYCNLALRTYEQQLVAPLGERGISLVALSPQKPDGSLTIRETNELTFDVLSDPGNGIAGRLGILITHGDDVHAAQAARGVVVAERNTDSTATIPMPTTVLVDETGTIRWIDVHPDFSTRTEPAEILAATRLLTT
jgi:peroxiredoxin